MSADRRRARQEALVALLDAEGLDGLLVTSRANIRYLTGFSGSAALAVVTKHDALLVTDFRYDEQAREEAGPVARVAVERTSVWERLFKELAAFGPLATMGYEAQALTVRDAGRLSDQGGAWRWKAAGELTEVGTGDPGPPRRRDGGGRGRGGDGRGRSRGADGNRRRQGRR